MDAFSTKWSSEQSTVILDGGLATELERQGADLSGHLWSARLLKDDPDLIYRTHKAYYAAGADVATTASYQATVKGFMQLGLDEKEAEELMKKSIQLAKKARDDFWIECDEVTKSSRRFPLVAASIGCYGASLADGSEFHGNYRMNMTADDLKKFHRPRMLLLAQEAPDVFACETVPCIVEAVALAELLEEPELQALGVPAWISVSFREGACLASGEALADLAASLASSPSSSAAATASSTASSTRKDVWARGGGLLTAVGINCGPPAHAEAALLALADGGPGRRLVCYPNRGEEWDAERRDWVAATGTADCGFADACRAWHTAGARLLGGCCRTTPLTISAIRAALA